MYAHSSLLAIFVAFVCVSSSMVQADQPVCQNGGVNYSCPSVDSEHNRWGLAFRRFVPYPTARTTVANFSPFSFTVCFNTGLAALDQYMSGDNANKTIISPTIPRIMQSVYRNGEYIACGVEQPLPYDAIPPSPNNASVSVQPPRTSPFVTAVLWWHEPPTEESVVQHRDTLNSILAAHNLRSPSTAFWWASWTGAHSTEHYNEVWVVLEMTNSTSPLWSMFHPSPMVSHTEVRKAIPHARSNRKPH